MDVFRGGFVAGLRSSSLICCSFVTRNCENFLYLFERPFFQPSKILLPNEHSFHFLARARRFPRCAGGGVDLLLADEARGRGYGAYARNRRARPQGRHGLPAPAVQGRPHRLPRPGALLRLPGLRRGRAEPVGSLRIPHGRFLLGPGWLLRHEDRDLCLGPHGQRRAAVARPRPEGRLPQRRRHGARGRGPRTARHFVLVSDSGPFHRRGRAAEARRHHDDDADLRHGRFDAGPLRACRWRHLHQGGRRGRRPRGQGRGGDSRG